MTTAVQENRWQARPALAGLLRVLLLAVPLVASCLAVYALAGWLPPDAASSGWGLAAMLSLGLLVATAVERAARRLLPIALLLKLSMIFPDRAPSRLRMARTVVTTPRHELLWTGSSLQPTSTSDLVLNLVGALGAHDRRTRGHSERVRLLCDVLAVELGLDERDRDRLRWAALLHDVGKVEVAARILNKPSRLDPAEFDEVRLHPAAGAALAAPLLPWLGLWGDGILDHHERFDGTGYPHGKAGDEISEAGRLIAVIDAFETMTAARPYKKAMATRAAREELARCAGTHFDPLYVRAFLAVSLPRLLWAMGPVSFVVQLPFLSSIAQTGVRAGATVPQAAGALAAGAAGAAVIAGGATGTTPVAADPLPPGTTTAQRDVPREDRGEPTDVTALSPGRSAALPTSRPATPPRTSTTTSGPTARPATTSRPVAPATAAPRRAPSPRPAATSATTPSAGDTRPGEDHPAIESGPPATTTSRTAVFELADDRTWECKLSRAADGDPSRWEPCAGTFRITVRNDGTHVLRVRDAVTGDEVDSWDWTVTPEAGPAVADPAPKANAK